MVPIRRGPREVTLLTDVVDQSLRINVGHNNTTGQGALQQSARRLFAQARLELGLAQAAVLQGKCVPFAVKSAGHPLKRGDSQDLVAQIFIPDGDAHCAGFMIKRALGDDALQHGLIQPDLHAPARKEATGRFVAGRSEFPAPIGGHSR